MSLLLLLSCHFLSASWSLNKLNKEMPTLEIQLLCNDFRWISFILQSNLFNSVFATKLLRICPPCIRLMFSFTIDCQNCPYEYKISFKLKKIILGFEGEGFRANEPALDLGTINSDILFCFILSAPKPWDKYLNIWRLTYNEQWKL